VIEDVRFRKKKIINDKTSNDKIKRAEKRSQDSAQSTKDNTRILDACSLGVKKDMRVLFATFYSPVETVFAHR
jgi:hypothetical protein